MKLTIKEAFWLFGTHVALAAGVTLILLMAIEWLMPGSVLPFVDVFDLLLPVSVLLLIMLAHQAKASMLSRLAQLLLVGCGGVLLLAILAMRVQNYSPSVLALLGAFVILIAVWIFGAAKPENI
ncbi:MAG: hypothetical protein PHC70_01675 [Patescibacteria group bacterium]|nr:hypothetical protein [Patescibacteria group bacterium]